MGKIKKLYIFALGAHGVGLSGGDRIFIELARRWSEKFAVDIHLWQQGLNMCKSQNLTGKFLSFKKSSIPTWSEKYFVLNYILRVLEGIRLGLTLKLENSQDIYLYNASEFWMDSFPCVLLKLRYPKVKWVATWYQTAPSPFKGYAEGKRDTVYRAKAFQYWFAQLPVMPLIKKFADKVIVNNEDEKKRYPTHTKNNNTIVLIGAVPLKDIRLWLKSHKTVKKVYDCVFQGRFHPQKGVLELIEIWRLVVDKKPDAKLGMIGDGSLMKEVKLKINELKLGKNIKLLGYVFDGEEKYQLFASGKVVVHPAFYDSGGMASAEAMAFGLPCVGFDLKAYESYYPKGMQKVALGDKKEFAKEVLHLLSDQKYYKSVAADATEMIEKNWSWETRASQILNEITS